MKKLKNTLLNANVLFKAFYRINHSEVSGRMQLLTLAVSLMHLSSLPALLSLRNKIPCKK